MLPVLEHGARWRFTQRDEVRGGKISIQLGKTATT
jgi:hypothetical protein